MDTLTRTVNVHIAEFNRAKDTDTIRVKKMNKSLAQVLEKINNPEGYLHANYAVSWPICTEQDVAKLEKKIADDPLFANQLVIIF